LNYLDTLNLKIYKYQNKMNIFLDYYHPYAGLCNQLYLITNHIHDAYKKGVKIYINKVNVDIFKKERVPADQIFDLDKTSDNLKNLLKVDIILKEPPEQIFIPRLCIYPVSSIEILSCLEFQSKFYPNVNGYTGIHFRIEFDVIIHYLFSKECYEDYMTKSNTGVNLTKFCENLMNLFEVKYYIYLLLQQYYQFIRELKSDRYFICTSVGKKEDQKLLLPVLKQLEDFIKKQNATLFVNKMMYPQRELNALVDLLTLRNSEKLIVFEGSSYSEGYCLKYHQAKNNLKEYRTVNGIVPKVDDKLYYSC